MMARLRAKIQAVTGHYVIGVPNNCAGYGRGKIVILKSNEMRICMSHDVNMEMNNKW
jgi:uncharacterized protein (UPF0254 family)